MKPLFFSLAVVATLLSVSLSFEGCASAAKKEATALTAADSAAIAAAVNLKMRGDSAQHVAGGATEEPALPQNIDAAHESFIRAQEMELRGERALANVFWQHAAESDPYNRYLTFKLAEIMAAQGADSLALEQAQHAQRLKGRQTASQLGLLAHLYVKDGRADSARKYFNAALDSSKYQDMTLLYDYSLFLEAVQDAKELVRVPEWGGNGEAKDVLPKIREEIAELEEAAANGEGDARVKEELGDVLFAVANYARHLHVDSESALENTTRKFSRRFRFVEAAAKAQGRDLKSMTLDEMENLWQRAKDGEWTSAS